MAHAIHPAAASAATPAHPGHPSPIPADRLRAALAAHNAAGLASSYIERGNFTAARRKLVQALKAVNELQGGAA